MSDVDERDNRCRLARERAGLSIGQAAKLLGIDRAELQRIEDPSRQMVERADDLAALYHVDVEWLTGHKPLRDYDAMRGVRGYDELSPHDRDAVAEFAASLPSRPSCPSVRAGSHQPTQRCILSEGHKGEHRYL